jgi:GntR family transcriptional regulator
LSTLFESVKTTIRDRLEARIYRPGDKIPSGTALVKEFGVSAITVRRALRDLVIEGTLVTRPGIGVFVAGATRVSRSLDEDFMFSLGERMKQAGVAPGLKELSLELIRPDTTVGTALGLRSNEFVYRHEKLILADNGPVSIDVTYLPENLGRRLRSGIASEFIIPLLIDSGIQLEKIRYRIEARSASEREAKSLGVNAGAPLLSVQYAPLNSNRKPILIGHIVSLANMFSYELSVPVRVKATGTKKRASRTSRARGRDRKTQIFS